MRISNTELTAHGLRELTTGEMETVSGGLISSANLPHRPDLPSLGPNLGNYADWYYVTYGFGGSGGNSMNGASPTTPFGRPA
jgi:hypothetical protein